MPEDRSDDHWRDTDAPLLRWTDPSADAKSDHRLMRRHGMVGRFHRRRVVTTIAGVTAYVIPDLIGDRFAPGKPNTAWCQDITYIATGEGWLYMASVVDLGLRRLLGYSMADHMRTELVTDASPMAVGARHRIVNGVIVHAGGGTQYTSNDPRSGAPACVGIAVAESFWESLKRECIKGTTFTTRAEARRSSDGSTGHNTGRLHSSLGYTPPITWEQSFPQAS